MSRFLALILLGSLASPVQAAPPEEIEQIRLVIANRLASQPDNRLLRFQYAQASYQTGHHDAAKYHLQYLMRTTRGPDELKQLQEAYATVVDASPWSFGINLSLLPSTNIDKTSSNAIFDTPYGQFLITGGGEEKSGVGLRYGGSIGYETTLESGASLSYHLEANRNQYPTERLSYDDGLVRVIWGMRRVDGFTQISPYVRRYVYADSEENHSNSNRYGLLFSHEHYLSDESSVTGIVTVERRDYDDLDYLNGSFFAATTVYRGVLNEDYGLQLALGLEQSTPKQKHLRYHAASFAGELTRAIGDIGVIGMNFGLDLRRYRGDFPTMDESRKDREASIGMSFRSPHLKAFDTSPKLSCSYHQNWSNVALYDYSSTDCAVTFERDF